MFGRKKEELQQPAPPPPQFTVGPEGAQPQIVYVQAPPPAKKRGGCLKIVGSIAFVGIVVLIIAALASNGNSSSGTNSSSSQPQPTVAVRATEVPVEPTIEPTEPPIEYQEVTDFRELVQRPGGMMGDHISFEGEVINIGQTGEKVYLGDRDPKPYDAQLQIGVVLPDDSYDDFFIAYNGDLGNIFEGSRIRAYGTVVDVMTAVSELGGGQSLETLVSADRIEAIP